ncbi:MAG: tol-pal system protein YbgF [Deltaproteobacteria bacterium]|jgi:tol-pal system protein YbgF|nr:tol-pal system protein YbgF [Deltaproteobacteria bacterium]
MLQTISRLAILALLLALPACSGSAIGGGGSMQRELDALKMEVADLRDRARLGGAPGGTQNMELDNLRTSVQRLTENVETATVGGLTLRQQLEYVSARLDRLEKRANLPPLSTDIVGPTPVLMPSVVQAYPGPEAGLEPGAPGALPPGAVPPEAVPPGTPVVPAAPGQDPGTVAAATPAAPVAARTAYDEGKDLFDQKNYPAAVERFRAYQAESPQGTQAAAAQFYVGESFYFQNQFEEAILEYQTLISGFPKNNLVSTALLKQGLSFQALGDKASAKLIYQKVVREYSKSYSAGIARERLKTI